MSLITTLAATVAFTVTSIQYSYAAYKYIYCPLFGSTNNGAIQIVVPVSDLWSKNKQNKVIEDELECIKADLDALGKTLLKNHFQPKNPKKKKTKRRHSI